MFGYACINTVLNKAGVTTNRSMINKTFKEKGLSYVSQLSLANALDLSRIIEWNEQNDIRFFRMSSDLIPWYSEFQLEQLDGFEELKELLSNAGMVAASYGHRITTHPGPFNKLCSPNDEVVVKTIKELENHGNIFDLMGLSRTPYNKINIHVGAAYGDKAYAADLFCKNFDRLNDSVKSRLTVENDDRSSMFSVSELYEMIYKRIGIPIVADYHHWEVSEDPMPWNEALEVAASTWGNVKPVVHHSNSRAIEQDNPKIKPQAHSDFYFKKFPDTELDIDIMLESKMKEAALKKYILDFEQ